MKNKYFFIFIFLCSLIPLVISIIVFVDKIPLKNTEESWKFFASLIGFILSLVLFNTVIFILFLLKLMPRVKAWVEKNK